MKINCLVLAVLILSLPCSSSAVEKGTGVAEMNLTIEGGSIYVEAFIPAQPALGVSTMPEAESEKNILKKRLSAFKNKSFLNFSKLSLEKCALKDSVIDFQVSTFTAPSKGNEAEDILTTENEPLETGSEATVDESVEGAPVDFDNIADETPENYGQEDSFPEGDTTSDEISELYIYSMQEYRCADNMEPTTLNTSIFQIYPQLGGVHVNGINNGSSFSTYLQKNESVISLW